VDAVLEREFIADHFDPPMSFSVVPAPGLDDADERADYDDRFLN